MLEIITGKSSKGYKRKKSNTELFKKRINIHKCRGFIMATDFTCIPLCMLILIQWKSRTIFCIQYIYIYT